MDMEKDAPAAVMDMEKDMNTGKGAPVSIGIVAETDRFRTT